MRSSVDARRGGRVRLLNVVIPGGELRSCLCPRPLLFQKSCSDPLTHFFKYRHRVSRHHTQASANASPDVAHVHLVCSHLPPCLRLRLPCQQRREWSLFSSVSSSCFWEANSFIHAQSLQRIHSRWGSICPLEPCPATRLKVTVPRYAQKCSVHSL